MADARSTFRAVPAILAVTAIAATGVDAADRVAAPTIGAVRVETASAPSAALADDDVVLLSEEFEEPWPAPPWSVTHPDGAADVDWGRTGHRAAAGSFSIRCAGAGPQAPAPGGPAPPGTASWTIVGPFDLSEASSGRLRFELWLETEPVHDLFMWLASTDGRVFNGAGTTASTGGWRSMSVDLAAWGDAGSVLGAERVWIAFVYASDHSEAYEGAYVDEVRLTADFGSPAADGITYTTTADFDTGTMIGVEAADDALRLVDGWSALPYLWVPTTSRGVVSRLDVDDGAELARYRTGPERDLEPSAVAVDLDGSCWVGNQAAGTVVKIGLEERGDCVDRDGDGGIDTSRDDDGDGVISAGELLDWGDDECVLYEVSLVDGAVGVHVPGEEHQGYAANGVGAIAVDADNAVWVGVRLDRRLYLVDGSSGAVLDTVDLSNDEFEPSGSVVDGNGRLWVAGWPATELLRLDNAGGVDLFFDLGHPALAVGIDDAGHVFGTEGAGGRLARLDTADGDPGWTNDAGVDAFGVKASEDGDIWVAVPGGRVVQRFTPGGFVRATVPVGGAPTEVAIDASGRVWTVGAASALIERIDPGTNRNDLDVELVDAGAHDAVGDLTGVVSRSLTTRFGSWRVVFDTEAAATPWGTIEWTATEPAGTEIRVRVRSSEDEVVWSAWEEAQSGAALAATPAGRHLQIEVTMQVMSGGELPELEELTATPLPAAEAPTAAFTWSPDAPEAGEEVQFTDTSTGVPTSWAWDFGDGASSTDRNPRHTFASEGTYTVVLTVTNAGGADTGSADVTVVPAGGCTVDCAAVVPPTGVAGEPVAFEASASGSGCTQDVQYLWMFGDGATGVDASTTHTFTAAGAWEWRLEATADGAACGASGSLRIAGAADGCARPRWIAVASHVGGAGGSVWRTDLGLLGVAGGSGAADLVLHAPDGAVTRRVELGSAEMVDLADVVRWIAPGADLSAAVEVCTDGPLVVTSRTFNRLASDDPCLPGGTFGQRLDGLEPSDGLHAGEVAVLPQLRENDGFRTNLGFTNTSLGAATVRVTLRDAAGDPLASYTVELDPGGWRQDNRPFAVRGGVSDLAAGSARLEVVAGAGVLAYASVIDNLTGDASTVLPHRLESAR